MKTEYKVIIGISLLTAALLFGGIFLVNKTDTNSSRPLLGQEVKVLSRKHVPDGTKVKYNSNPPAAGAHYAKPQDAGAYMTAPADGHLVHSLEHGAVILWYQPDIPPNDLYRLTKIFAEIPGAKKIMTPRENMSTPLALTSWGRILKLKKVDEAQIKDFFNTNMNRAPEDAAI